MTFLLNYLYPIAWWIVLPCLDALNYRWRGESLWRGQARHFFLITFPLSVIYWTGFEVLNLFFPQWRYVGGIRTLSVQVAFGAVAFATVIPIMVECYWLVAGRICVPAGLERAAARHTPAFLIAGLLCLLTPLVSDFFWVNQVMWIGPAIMLLPYAQKKACRDGRSFWMGIVFGSLLAGLLWEAINFQAQTRWQYSIEMQQPHLFEMPVFGYLGVIPFGVSTLIVYEWQRRISATRSTGLALYVIALGTLWIMTRIYVDRGLWVFT